MAVSVSFCKGKGSLNHNNRKFITPNVDRERTKDNIIYKQEVLQDVYNKLFGEALNTYNAKQKRSDRQIPDYITHIKNSKNGEKVFYESLVQVGTMYDCHVGTKEGDLAAKILDEYMRDFQERNPNLYVFNAVLHLDEATPHLHIDWIPVATDYKQGLSVRNSLDKAIKQQGIDGLGGKSANSTQNWQKRERDHLIKIMERHGLRYQASPEPERDNLTLKQYKAMERAIDKRVADLPDKIESKPLPMNKDKVIVSKEDLASLEEKVKLLEVREDTNERLRNYWNEKKKDIQEKHSTFFKDLDDVAKDRKYLINQIISADEKHKKYKDLYEEQLDLNLKYEELKKENSSLRGQITLLKGELKKLKESFNEQVNAFRTSFRELMEVFRDVVQAVGMLKYDNHEGYKINDLSPKQSKLIDAVATVGSTLAKEFEFNDLAKDMDETVKISDSIRSVIEPKKKMLNQDGPSH